jgi:hypothetical protein
MLFRRFSNVSSTSKPKKKHTPASTFENSFSQFFHYRHQKLRRVSYKFTLTPYERVNPIEIEQFEIASHTLKGHSKRQKIWDFVSPTIRTEQYNNNNNDDDDDGSQPL